MSDILVYHNTLCSKSNGAVALLEEKGIPYDLRLYLDEPLNAGELKALLQKLNIEASALLRSKELLYEELYAGKTMSEDDCIEAMVRHPELIERPIVVKGNKAIIARPPEKILDMI